MVMRIGLVSDTHSRFDASLPRLLDGCDLILHAGDVMGHDIITALQELAPVLAVRGNNDWGDLSCGLNETASVRVEELMLLMIHDLGRPEKPNPSARNAMQRVGPDIVVYGHTHEAAVGMVKKKLFVNPGSVGVRRSSMPRSAGLLTVNAREVRVELYDLESAALPLLFKPFEVEL